MRFVKVEESQESWPSTVLDPEPYLEVLDVLSSQLPDGARTFIMDPDHYDFSASRCVKDLSFSAINIREIGHAQVELEILFGANKWKHDADLAIRYLDVKRLDLDVKSMNTESRVWPESRRLGDVQLDEILPISVGCSHEVKLTGGIILVECADLRAEWLDVSAS